MNAGGINEILQSDDNCTDNDNSDIDPDYNICELPI